MHLAPLAAPAAAVLLWSFPPARGRRGHGRNCGSFSGASHRPEAGVVMAETGVVSQEIGVGDARVGGEAPGWHAGALELALESPSEVKVGEFRPAVRAPGLVLPLHVRVGRIDRMGPMAKEAGDVDDPGRVGGQDAGHKLGGECPVSEVVHAELQFVAIGGALFGCGHDAGVVDEDVDLRVRGEDRRRCRLDGGLRSRGRVGRLRATRQSAW